MVLLAVVAAVDDPRILPPSPLGKDQVYKFVHVDIPV